MGLTDLAAYTGMLTGTVGIVLGIISYFRDRASVEVILRWDMAVTRNPLYSSSKLWAIVTVANSGRRAICLSRVSLKLPRGSESKYLVHPDSVPGQKLCEGDPEVTYIFDQGRVEKYKKKWKKIEAAVFDTAGKKYYSKVDKSKPPSWAQ